MIEPLMAQKTVKSPQILSGGFLITKQNHKKPNLWFTKILNISYKREIKSLVPLLWRIESV